MPHPAEPAPRWAPECLLLRRASRPGALLSNLRFLLLAPRTGRGPAPFIPPQPRLPLPAVAASLLLHLALTAAVFLQRRAPAVERHLVFASEAVPIYWYGPPPRLRPPLSSRAPANFRALHPRAMVWFTPPRPTNRWQTLMEPAAPPEAPRWLPPAQNIVAWPRPQLPALAAAGHAVAPAHSPAAGAALAPLRDAVPQADRLQLGVALAPPPALAAPHARLSASAASASDTLPALLQKAAPGPPFIALSETPGPNPPPLGQAQLLWPSDRVLHPSAPLRLRQRSPPPGGRPTCWCCCRLNRHRHRPRQRPLRPQLPPAPRPQRRLRFSCRARRRAGCPRATCSGLIAAHRSLPAARLVTCWSTCPTSPARPEAGS